MDHNKVIRAAAKGALAPLGLIQQRNSRIWYDDHGWWAIVVEFQPSGFDRGSYLNVAVAWMLYECEHWAFDIGGRAEGFHAASGEHQFEAAMSAVAAVAARKVIEYRERFSTLEDMRSYYQTVDGQGGWPDYYAGVLEGLCGDRASAERRFMAVISAPASFTWHRALQFRSQDLLRLLGNPGFFRDSILGIVLRCRAGRCLGEMPVEEIALP
jgi:hypothetical protein